MGEQGGDTPPQVLRYWPKARRSWSNGSGTSWTTFAACPALARVSRLPLGLPFTTSCCPPPRSTCARLLMASAAGMGRPAQRGAIWRRATSPFTMTAELLLIAAQLRWFCKSKTVASRACWRADLPPPSCWPRSRPRQGNYLAPTGPGVIPGQPAPAPPRLGNPAAPCQARGHLPRQQMAAAGMRTTMETSLRQRHMGFRGAVSAMANSTSTQATGLTAATSSAKRFTARPTKAARQLGGVCAGATGANLPTTHCQLPHASPPEWGDQQHDLHHAAV